MKEIDGSLERQERRVVLFFLNKLKLARTSPLATEKIRREMQERLSPTKTTDG